MAKQPVGNERIYVYINGEKVEAGSSKYKAYIERMQSFPKVYDNVDFAMQAEYVAEKVNTIYANASAGLQVGYPPVNKFWDTNVEKGILLNAWNENHWSGDTGYTISECIAKLNSDKGIFAFNSNGFITSLLCGFAQEKGSITQYARGGAISKSSDNVVDFVGGDDFIAKWSYPNINFSTQVGADKSPYIKDLFDENSTKKVKINGSEFVVNLPIIRKGEILHIKKLNSANELISIFGVYLGKGLIAAATYYSADEYNIKYTFTQESSTPYIDNLDYRGVKIFLIENMYEYQIYNKNPLLGDSYKILYENNMDLPNEVSGQMLIGMSAYPAIRLQLNPDKGEYFQILRSVNVDYSGTNLNGYQRVPAKDLDDLKGNPGSTDLSIPVTEDKTIIVKADYGNNEDKLLVKLSELGRYQFVGYKGGDFPWKFISPYSTTPGELYATGVDITKPYPSLDYNINSYALENGNLDSTNFNQIHFNITNFIKTSSAYSINPSQPGQYKLTYKVSKEGISTVPNDSIVADFFNDTENIVLLNSDFVKSNSVKFINISNVDFLLFGPQQKPSKNLPLIVWFYGTGENKKDAQTLYKNGLANIIRNWNTQTNGKYLNCYVMCVRNPGDNSSYWVGEFPSNLYNCINSLKNTLPIATNKIILIGHSNGTRACGFYAWYDRQEITSNPIGFSANVMISPYSPGGKAETEDLIKNFPTHAFIETNEPKGFSSSYITKLKNIYGADSCEYIQGASHSTIVGKVFNQLDNGVVKVLDWAFKQGVSEPASGTQTVITGSIPAGGSYWSISDGTQELSKISHLSLLGITISGDGTFWNSGDFITISITDTESSYTIDEATLLNYFKNNNYPNGPSYIYGLTEVPFKAYVYNPFKETDILVSKYALGITSNNASESDVITCEFNGNAVLNTLEGVNIYYNTIYMSTKDLLEQINNQNIYITKQITQSNNIGSSSAVTEIAKIINHEWGSNNNINTLYMRGNADTTIPKNISTLDRIPSSAMPQSNLGTGVLQGLFMRFLVGAVVINTAQAQASQYDNWYDKVTHVKAATWGTYQTKYRYKTFDEDTAGKSDAYKGELLFIAMCVVNGLFSLPSNICIYAEPSIAHKYIKKLLIANSAGLKPCIGVDRTPLKAFSSKDVHGNTIDVSAANNNTNNGILAYIKTLWQRAYDLYSANSANFAQFYQDFKNGQPINITVPNS